jgi:hypothetical protein
MPRWSVKHTTISFVLIKNWKKIPLQKKHNAYQRLVLLWKPHSWSSPWINFHVWLEHISATDSWKPHSWSSPWINFHVWLEHISATDSAYTFDKSLNGPLALSFDINFVVAVIHFLPPYQLSSRQIIS